MDYNPSPVYTGDVELATDLEHLTEILAENAHDLWALQRQTDGWTYGPERDDEFKRHPCLVPYADLPDSEKEYDRKTAIGTLKLIVALGFRIEKKKRKYVRKVQETTVEIA